MWQTIIQMLIDSVSSAFGWFTSILNTDRLIWSTIYYLIVALFATRLVLGPILGFTWVGQADKAIKNFRKSDKSGDK